MSSFKTLSSHERGVVWHQFSKVTKQGLYYMVKCNLCSEDVFIQGRLKTMHYHYGPSIKIFVLRTLAMSRSFLHQHQVYLRYHRGQQLQMTTPSRKIKAGNDKEEELVRIMG